jgi:hypothetical protein
MSFFGTLGRNLAGAWALMLGRASGLDRLDLTVAGFWRSFGAIVLIAPAAFLSFLSDRHIAALSGEPLGALSADASADTLALVVDWLAFPALFAALARPLGLGAAYVPFMVGRNWAAVLMATGIAPIHLLILANILPAQAAPVVLLIAVGVTLRFTYMLTRTALAVTARIAVPTVIIDFLLSITIWTAFSHLG